MRVVVQRVKQAAVVIREQTVAQIGNGVLLLVGLTHEDDEATVRKMAEKLVKMRIFADENGKTNLSLSQMDGEILSVSQFTLYGSLAEGNRPSFTMAMAADKARDLYAKFFEILSGLFPKIQGGVFQEDMQVSLTNDGPFTLILDSKEMLK